MNKGESKPGHSTSLPANAAVVLGFSGGLDTSYCVKYLSGEKGYDVHSIIVNTGGFTAEELKQIEAHAYSLGVKSHTTIDAVHDYYDRIIRFLVYGNVSARLFILPGTRKRSGPLP
jgi:argininosuccinate synthase